MSTRTPGRGRAVVYVRLSVYRGAEDTSVSPAEQERRCRAYAEAQGWDVVDVVRDLDVSGSAKGLRLDRPGLAAVRTLLPEVDAVIFAKLDRLARSVVDFRTFAEEAASHGAALVSVAEALDLSTPGGRFVSTILAAFAEMEADTIGERVRVARSALATAHRWGGGIAPFGYRSAPSPDGPGRVLEVDPAEAEVLAEAADRLLSGATLTAVCLDFNRRGVSTRRGGSWHASSLSAMITGDAAVGRLTSRGALVKGPDGLPVEAWPPALDPAVWRRVRETLAGRAAETAGGAKRTRRASRLLSGLAVCGSCGRPMALRRDRQGQAVYACPASSRGQVCPRGVSILAERLEEVAAGAFLGAVGRLPVLLRQEAADPAALARLADAEEALDRLAARFRDAEDDATEEALLAERRTLRAALPALREAAEATAPVMVETGETFAEAWEARDLAGRRAILGEALDHVSVAPAPGRTLRLDPSRVSLVWHPSPDEMPRTA